MNDFLSEQQLQDLLKCFDDAIQQGPWDKSNYLNALGKNLSDIRDKLALEFGAPSKAQIKTETIAANRMALRSGQQEIFVSLYSSDGSNLQFWEKIIANLPRQMISRPIYASEEHVQSIIKLKENKLNEAYVVIYINPNDIIPLHPDKALSDKLGNPLLALKDKTLNLENISRFIHLNMVYKYESGRLIKHT